jgi:hypothetical protein
MKRKRKVSEGRAGREGREGRELREGRERKGRRTRRTSILSEDLPVSVGNDDDVDLALSEHLWVELGDGGVHEVLALAAPEVSDRTTKKKEDERGS